jgi:rRNA maturation RNase YbeY
MLSFNYETGFSLNESRYSDWLSRVVLFNEFKLGDINYIFCDDHYLHKINKEFLQHDTFTDIITFDNSLGKELHADIFISVDRVRENAISYEVDFPVELQRVMVHGILHLMGYQDKTKAERQEMRKKEEECIIMFHVEHN